MTEIELYTDWNEQFRQRMAMRCLHSFVESAWRDVACVDNPYSARIAQRQCAQLIGVCHALNWVDAGEQEAVDFWLEVAVDWTCGLFEVAI